VGYVNSETCDSLVEPEPQDIFEELSNSRVLPIEIRLRGIEDV
jgi:hypothetical protein